jgi:hypothetical protein
VDSHDILLIGQQRDMRVQGWGPNMGFVPRIIKKEWYMFCIDN